MVVTNFLVPGSLVFAAVHVSLVIMSYKPPVIHCSATFYLYVNGKVLHV